MRARKTWIQRFFRIIAWLGLLFLAWGSIVLIGQFVGVPSRWAMGIALLCWGAIIRFLPLKKGAYLIFLAGIVAAAGYFLQSPSRERDWMPEIARLPQFEQADGMLYVKNLRDFEWRSNEDFEERWMEASYDLNRLSGLDVIVVPFGDSELAAHVMLSFAFNDGRRLALSVESRREVGEDYSLLGGAARQLELIYLFGTERDLLGLRILHRGNRVYSFPLKLDVEFTKDLLLELCQSANQLLEEPKFYATLRHNCTTTLLRHVNKIREEPIKLHFEILFPAKLGQLLHRLNYMDTNLDWERAKAHFQVDRNIKAAPDLSDFSRVLRSE